MDDKVTRQLDGIEQAIARGEVVDQNFNVIKADPAAPKAEPLDAEEQTSHLGTLKPGEVGWVELSADGAPIGGAHKFPLKDKPQAPVATLVENTPSVLATPAGAFLTDRNMQPSPASYKYASSAYGRDYVAAENDRRKWKGLPPLSTSAAPKAPSKAA